MSITIEMAGAVVSVPHLSPSEKTCLLMVAEGRTLPEIGLFLGLTDSAVETLLSATEEKLGAHNRLHAVSIAMLRGHVEYENAKPD